MKGYQFPVSRPLLYHFTGKFESPSIDWRHEQLPLNDYELIIMTDGALYLQYMDMRYAVKKGEALLLPPSPPPKNLRRGYQSASSSFYWLHFSCKEEVIETSSLTGLPLCESRPDCESITLPASFAISFPEKIIILMKQLQDAVRSGYQAVVLNYMTTSVLCELYQQFLIQTDSCPPAKKTQSQVYHDIMDFVTRHINEPLTVSRIAASFGYNEKYLSHMFSSLSGIPLKQFILNSKINEANFLLSDTNMHVSDISGILGFTDPHHFMKCYKKITGLTPTEYRNAFSQRMLFHK